MSYSVTTPIRVGIVGTGYAAKRRAEAIQADERAHLGFVTGHSQTRTEEFCQAYKIAALDSWETLVNHPEIDLVIICTINAIHGKIARAALEAGKHVVTEYPLTDNPEEGAHLIALAQAKNQLLHIEHIELLGGLHQTMRQYLPALGQVFYARYATITPQRPAPHRWTYHQTHFGFPLIAALSRIHRLTDLFGTVDTVFGHLKYWDSTETDYFTSCLCNAQLKFTNGLVADIIYGKGEHFWQSDRTFELDGDQGSLVFDGQKGLLIQGQENIPLDAGTPKGLFTKDTHMVLDNLLAGTKLYMSPQQSLYALKVAAAVAESAISGHSVRVS